MKTTKKQPAALAAYQQRKQEQEAAALAPYTVKREKYGRGYIVSTTGADYIELDDNSGACKSFETKKAAVAWILEEKKTATETKKEEANTMENTFTFTAETITCKGKTFPAEYSISPAGAVTVFVKMDESSAEKKRVRFNLDHPAYAAAHAAALEQREKAAAARRAEHEKPAAPAPVETPAPVADPAPAAETARPETISTDETPAARPDRAPLDKPARGPVPEKTFIGQAITGNGWKILFDGETARTRIIFESNPTDAARAALDKAGFFFSAGMNSWNKKLTFKAYRAAQALAAELTALYPAAAA